MENEISDGKSSGSVEIVVPRGVTNTSSRVGAIEKDCTVWRQGYRLPVH